MTYVTWTQEKYEEFVSVWQTSSSVTEVAKHFGISRQAAANRASNLRARGVQLKKYRGMRVVDYGKLQRMIEEKN